MRPLKLTMTAFGPYAGKEVIDFNKLQGKNIFLITGPTGAGKTTIFDGISYAVFGSASSDERDGESLRSHFASEDLLTSVELEFELRGKRYYIKRIPKQQKRKAKGQGLTEQKTEAYLELINEGDGEKAVYVSGVQQVNDKVAQILGINCAQFRQIMMIPQGEFRKLITEDSRDREQILQKIFGTEGYKKVQDALGEKAKKLYNDSRNYNSRIDENIHNLNTTGDEILQELTAAKDMNRDEIELQVTRLIHQDTAQEKELSVEIQKIHKSIVDKNKEIFEANEIKNKFDLKNRIEENKAKLETSQPEINLKTQRLNKGRRALTLTGLEDNYRSKKDAVDAREKELQKESVQAAAAEKALKLAEIMLNAEQEKEPARNKLLRDAAILQGFMPKVKELADKHIKVKRLEKECKEQEELAKNKKSEAENSRNQLKNLNQELQKISEAKDSYVIIADQLEGKNRSADKLGKLLEENDKLTDIRNECMKVQKSHQQIRLQYDKFKEKYENLQDMFFKGQAGLLSSRLEEGKPCPVCGSVHHPSPARLAEETPDEGALKQVKERFSEAQEKYNQSSESLNRLLGQGKAQKEAVEKLKSELEEKYQEEVMCREKELLSACLKDFIKALNTEINRLKGEKRDKERLINTEKALLEQKDKLNIKIEEDDTAFEAADSLYRSCETALKSEQSLLEAVKKELPENIDSEEKLAAAISKTENELANLKQALVNAEEGHKAAKLEHVKSLTSRASASTNLDKAREELDELEEKFNASILSAGFESRVDYEKSKLPEQQVESLEKEITTFNQNLKSICDSLIKAEKDIEGLKMKDIKVMEDELEGINARRTSADNEKKEVYARRIQNEKIMDSICSLKQELKKTEDEYKIVGDLANAARGFNSEKITFERYVLAAFFDDIINAANLRFTKMTGSRYEMSRIKEKSKGNVQSGLEIEVLDNYTGRTRHIKTLSGGESFKASLSLALGLADVVQSYAGGISMDTMFIDEGFGTLDPESLDNAVQSLIELQSTGRLVGIISHVPELKERIDARLEIIPSKQGSSTVFNV